MQDLFKRINNVLDEQIQLNQKAMICCHSLGYNGFKRLHRCANKYYICLQNKLANELFDNYGGKLDVDRHIYNYSPQNLKDHLQMWERKLKDDIKTLGMLNKEHFNEVGLENCVINSLLGCLRHKYEKVCRWYKRFEEGQWLVHDCHIVDDYLHKKYKKKGA